MELFNRENNLLRPFIEGCSSITVSAQHFKTLDIKQKNCFLHKNSLTGCIRFDETRGKFYLVEKSWWVRDDTNMKTYSEMWINNNGVLIKKIVRVKGKGKKKLCSIWCLLEVYASMILYVLRFKSFSPCASVFEIKRRQKSCGTSLKRKSVEKKL